MDRKEYMCIPAFIRLSFRHLTLAEKWLYVCLADLCQTGQEYRLDLSTLEKETGLARSTLSGILPRLEAYGLIHAQKKSSGPTNHEAWHITLHPFTLEQAHSLSVQFEKYSKPGSIAREIEVVNNQVNRAIQANTSATLTLTEWLETLDHFQRKCAYCQGPYEVLEHFVPLVLGGGTTRANCVPACARCNGKKNGYHPLLLPASIDLKEAIERVRQYLSSQKSEVEL